MIINHNISALNTLNRLNKNSKNTASAMEKLSSGLRINKASDDSAGLAISEKMRAQIRGIQQAQRNTQDGISLIQTAESGLGTIQDPNLLRLRELAVQSANDTLTDEDRQQIQKEVQQVKEGINEIANNTEFNGIKLLNVKDTTTKEVTQTTMEPVTTTTTGYESTTSPIDLDSKSITIYETYGGDGMFKSEITFNVSDLKNGISWSPSTSYGNERYLFSVDLSQNTFTSRALSGGGTYTPNNNITRVTLNNVTDYDTTGPYSNQQDANKLVSYVGTPLDSSTTPDNVLTVYDTDSTFFMDEGTDTYITVQFLARKETTTTTTTMEPVTTTIEEVETPPLNLQIGANSDDTFPVELTDARTTALGIDDIDLSTRQGAESAISQINQAMETVSSERGKFGAYQNRLEHSLSNASNYEMNLIASESRIRDADIANQTMEMTKNQILSQASQAMLSQANQKPQQVMQLISG